MSLKFSQKYSWGNYCFVSVFKVNHFARKRACDKDRAKTGRQEMGTVSSQRKCMMEKEAWPRS